MEAHSIRVADPDPASDQTIIRYRFFLMYRLDERNQSDQDGGSVEGGRTIWGEISGTIKNLGLIPNFILWGMGWQNLVMMSTDMPYWKADYKEEKSKSKKNLPDKLETKEDFENFLNL